MANIVKMQEDLKSIPLKNLIFYVQNPSGQVPSYLALAEIKRRKNMEQRAIAEQNAPSQLSVAEELTAPKQNIGPQFDTRQTMLAAQNQMAQGGVTGLDTGNMYDEKNFATGGIVAFADGGQADVDAMNLDVQPTLNLNSGESSYMIPPNMNANQFVAYGGLRGLMEDAARRNQGDARILNRMFGLGSKGNTMYDQFAAQARSKLAAGGEVKHFGQGGPSVADLRYQAALADSYLDPRYLVTGAKDLVSTGLFGYRVVRDPVTGELVRARDLPTATSELTKQKKSEVQSLLDRAQELEDAKKSDIAKKENLTELDPTLAATTFDRNALYKDPTMSEIYGMTKSKVNAIPAKGGVPPGATQPFNPAGSARDTVEKPKTSVDIAGDTARRFQEMMGPDPEREALLKKVQDLETGAKEQERMAPWLALTKAGFGIAAGKSPFALQNIGEGAQSGIAEYVAARDRLDKLNERQLDIRAKLNQVARAEKTAGVSAGFTKELKQLEEDNANARNAATNLVHLKTAAMTAAKKSDYETFLDLARQDEDNYKTVKDKDGNVRKVFDANKATQVYRSFSGSSGLDDDKLFEAWKQAKLLDKNFNLSFQEYRDQIRSAAGATSSSSSSSWGPLKVK